MVGGVGDREEWIDPPKGGVDPFSQSLSPTSGSRCVFNGGDHFFVVLRGFLTPLETRYTDAPRTHPSMKCASGVAATANIMGNENTPFKRFRGHGQEPTKSSLWLQNR